MFHKARVEHGLKSCVGQLVASPLMRPMVRKVFLRHINVVYYHFVGGRSPHYAEFYRGCTFERFREDLIHLRRHFEIVPLQKLLDFSHSREEWRAPLLAVTFDDGFNLNRPELLALLEENGVNVTTFVITSCLDNKNLMWRNKLSVIRHTVVEDVYVSKYNELSRKLSICSNPAGPGNDGRQFELGYVEKRGIDGRSLEKL